MLCLRPNLLLTRVRAPTPEQEIVSWDEVMPFVTQFHSLDSDNSGHLTTDDLAELAKQVNEKARAAAGKIGSSELDKLSQVAAEKRLGRASPTRGVDVKQTQTLRGSMFASLVLV